MKLLKYIFIIVILTIAGGYSSERIIHPNWAPKVIDLRPDDITTIMGYRAGLGGNLTHAPHPESFASKDALIYGFITDQDVMTWTVRVAETAEYKVSLLYCGDESILSDCKFELKSGNSVIQENTHPPIWEGKPYFQRHHVNKTLSLNKGENKISLRLTKIPKKQVKAAKNALENGKRNRLRDDSFCVWSIELVKPESYRAIKKRAENMRASIDWMKKGKYGLFVHWSPLVYPLYGDTQLKDMYQEMAKKFNVQTFADTAASMGVSWVCITTSHGAHYWPGPNETIDRTLPGRTCKRDLIGDLIQALGKYDIRLMLYYHFGWGEREDSGWAKAAGMLDADPGKWFNVVESIFRETSLRYGKDLATTAAYVDDCGFIAYQYDPPWERWARAIKAGNPNAPIGFSQSWGPTVSPFGEFQMTDGGGHLPEPYPDYMFEKHGQFEDLYPAVWFAIDGWRSRQPYNGTIGPGPRHETSGYIKSLKVLDDENIPATINLMITADVTKNKPFFNPECVEVMRKIKNAIKHP
jgi:hypothetical protein